MMNDMENTFSYEQAYKNALERAREFYNSKDSSATMKLVSLNIFPELAELRESEDERIRETIKKCIIHDCSLPWKETQECIAWLEKQNEIPMPN